MQRGPYVRVELVGLDGAGKSTLAQLLADHYQVPLNKTRLFSADSLAVDRQLRLLGGSELSDEYRSILLGKAILESVAKNSHSAIFDRFVESARMWWAAKGVQAPVDVAVLDRLAGRYLVIQLDVPVDTALGRRVGTTEYSVGEEREFLDRCNDFFDSRSASHPSWARLDATLPVEAVFKGAKAAIDDYYLISPSRPAGRADGLPP